MVYYKKEKFLSEFLSASLGKAKTKCSKEVVLFRLTQFNTMAKTIRAGVKWYTPGLWYAEYKIAKDSKNKLYSLINMRQLQILFN